jgi:hypothetical protein
MKFCRMFVYLNSNIFKTLYKYQLFFLKNKIAKIGFFSLNSDYTSNPGPYISLIQVMVVWIL